MYRTLRIVAYTYLVLSIGCCDFSCYDSFRLADSSLGGVGPRVPARVNSQVGCLYRARLAYSELPLGDALCP